MSWSARKLPFEGRLEGALIYVGIISLLGWLYIFEPASLFGIELPNNLLSRGVAFLIAVLGLSGASSYLRNHLTSEDYHEHYHRAATELIGNANASNEDELLETAMVLEGIDKGRAEETLREFSKDIADEYEG